MTVLVNENICFVESLGESPSLILTNKDSRDYTDIKKINEGNVFKDRKINFVQHINYNFSDDTNIKLSYGVRSSEDFDNINYIPFNDAQPNIEKTRDLSEFDTINFINHYNASTVHDMQHAISILGFYEEITGKLTTLNSLNGIKANVANYNTDARQRSVNIVTSFSNSDVNDKIEPYCDIVLEDDYVDAALERNFSYKTINVNGKNYQTLVFDNDNKIFVNRATNKVSYMIEDLLKIEPFYDNTKEKEKISVCLGSDIDKSNNIGTDSIAYLGVLN